MCILSYLPPGIGVDAEGLFNGGVNNPDGHGWAIVADGKIAVGKSLDLDQALEEFTDARRRYRQGPALFHSRWATHGATRVANCHPFMVGGSRKTVVAHNGVLPGEAHPGKGDDRSDTRLFADEILPTRFRRLDRVRAFRALSGWCGERNKLVILTVAPRYRHSVYLVNEAAGQWDETTGIWHSNGDYLGYPWWLDDQWVQAGTLVGDAVCVLCEGAFVDAFGYCEACGSCQDCYEHVRGCMCWVGRSIGGVVAGEDYDLAAGWVWTAG